MVKDKLSLIKRCADLTSVHAMAFTMLGCLMVACSEPTNHNYKTTRIVTQDSMFRDPHSYANAHQVLIKHLHLNLTVDVGASVLYGSVELTLHYLEPTNTIILDAMGLKIDRILDPTTHKEYTYSVSSTDSILGEALHISIGDEQPNTLKIHYKTSPSAAALQWIAPSLTAGKKCPLLFSQSQAILARSWIPLQDSPNVRFTYTADIQVPNGLLALMSASNPQKVASDGKYSFVMKQPIPSYLMAIAVGAFSFQPISGRTGIYAEREQLDGAVHEFTDLERMVKAAEDLFGPYAWDRYDLLVLPQSFPFGGMENPRLTFLTPSVIVGDRSLTSLIAHELAHSWSGNLVSNACWNDFWLNEGFTVYFERRIMEALYGKTYSDMLAGIGYGDLLEDINSLGPLHKDTWLKLDLTGRNPDDGLTDIAYEKGYFFLVHIEQKVGRASMDLFLRNYFRDFAFQSITTERFLEYLLDTLCQKNQAVYDSLKVHEWVYGLGLPINFTPPVSSYLSEAETAAVSWVDNQDVKNRIQAFNPFQHIQFLRRLEGKVTIRQLEVLDSLLRYSETPNPEVRTAWLSLALPLRYKPALYSAETFLKSTGRRKFLVPVYTALIQSDEGKIVAKNTYATAKKGYHFIAVETLDRLLGF